MIVESGTLLGPYEIGSRLGAGGMGEVWSARDTRLDRRVAVKILPAGLAHDAQFKLRFEREARTISQLSHPNICTLFDVGDGFLVMELLEGETLAARVWIARTCCGTQSARWRYDVKEVIDPLVDVLASARRPNFEATMSAFRTRSATVCDTLSDARR